MIHFFSGEEWKEFFPEGKAKLRYAVSNFGRLMNFTDNFENGILLQASVVKGYKYLGTRICKNGKSVYKHLFLHKLVAENFLAKDSAEQT